jgi:hypothetical protein
MLAEKLSGAVGNAANPNYIEDVFSTWLYTGNQDVNAIANGIDLSTKGGMVWIKDRTTGGSFYDNALYDTARGPRNAISSNLTAAQLTASSGREVTSFDTTGFTLGPSFNYSVNSFSENYASWTFRKQPKFFDVVTYTGNSTNRTIAHNLGSVPGCIIVKSTTQTSNWQVYHRSLTSAAYGIQLNDTAAQASFPTFWNSTAPTSTEFSIGTSSSVNLSGESFVAYIFAHDAGGFGLTGTDNVISCGSFTTDGSGNATVNLGYESQWVTVKCTSTAQNWYTEDNMRAFNLTSRAILFPNLSNAEATGASAYLSPSATGFSAVNGQLNASATYIYIAIRRGPMKVPTDATKVFSPVIYTGSGTNNFTTTVGFAADLAIWEQRNKANYTESVFSDRLRNPSYILDSASTSAEANYAPYDYVSFNNTQLVGGSSSGSGFNNSALPAVVWAFQRAPSFFDEVCYTGTGGNLTVSHNLGVAPELIIHKRRTGGTDNWQVLSNINATNYTRTILNGTSGGSVEAYDPTTFFTVLLYPPTSSSYVVSQYYASSGSTYVDYLFATCAGVSKVGSYTGTGTTKQIDCGFAAGARFVLIKRTDSTGDWWVWDTARGIVSGNDPYLLLNSTAAEVTSTDYIDPYSAGFELSSTAPAALNASGGTYIFLAIA